MEITVGVLALQGGITEHLNHLNQIKNAKGIPVKKTEQLKNCSGLIIPGGESTTMRKLIKKYDFTEAIQVFHQQGNFIWGTCAGLILLAAEVEEKNKNDQLLKLLNIKVKRNAFGSQLNSFTEKAVIPAISTEALELVFIRAPIITDVGKNIEILYQQQNQIAAVESSNVLGTTFHPELTESSAFHQYFVNKIRNNVK